MNDCREDADEKQEQGDIPCPLSINTKHGCRCGVALAGLAHQPANLTA
jgi:hypothetical protein